MNGGVYMLTLTLALFYVSYTRVCSLRHKEPELGVGKAKPLPHLLAASRLLEPPLSLLRPSIASPVVPVQRIIGEGKEESAEQEITLVPAEVCKKICSEEDVGINILRGGKFRREKYPLGRGEVGFLQNEKIYSQKEVEKTSKRVDKRRSHLTRTVWSQFECIDKECKKYRTARAPSPRKGMAHNVWCCESFSTPEYDYNTSECTIKGPFSHRLAYAAFDRVAKTLREHSVSFTLGLGTLLGAVRDGYIMCWEYDGEFFMLSPRDISSEKHKKLEASLRTTFTDVQTVTNQKFMGKTRPTQMDFYWRGAIYKIGIAINFVINGTEVGEKNSSYIIINTNRNHDGWLVEKSDWNDKRWASLNGMAFPVMNNAKQLLAKIYGKSWSKPYNGCHAGSSCKKITRKQERKNFLNK